MSKSADWLRGELGSYTARSDDCVRAVADGSGAIRSAESSARSSSAILSLSSAMQASTTALPAEAKLEPKCL